METARGIIAGTVVGLLIWLVLGVAFALSATTVNLEWDANTEADLAGYRLYQGTTQGGNFSQVQETGLVTTTSVLGLPDGQYCWKLTAFDTAGNESGFSNTVCLQADSTPPAPPSALRVTGVVVAP